jgi:hypothetical protein
MEVVELIVILIEVSQQLGFGAISPLCEECRDLVDCFPKCIDPSLREWLRDRRVASRTGSDKEDVKPASDNVLRSQQRHAANRTLRRSIAFQTGYVDAVDRRNRQLLVAVRPTYRR